MLDPARRARRAPVDLCVRYAIDPGTPLEDRAFDERFDLVRGYWQRIKHSSRRYAEIAATMLVDHHKVAADIERTAGRSGIGPGGPRYTAFLAMRDRRLAAVRDHVIAGIRRLTADCRCLTPQDVRWLVDYGYGAFGYDAVAAMVRGENVTIQEPCTLPTGPPSGPLRELRTNVALLGVSLSVEVVLGPAVAAGFQVLDGFRLVSGERRTIDAEALDELRQRAAQMPHQEPRTAPTRTVVAILSAAAASPSGLAELMLAEVVHAVLDRASGRHEVGVLTTIATGLGLRRDEAELLALSLAAQARENPAVDLPTRIDLALAAGGLREAQRLAAQLGDRGPARVREDLARRVAEVEALLAEADEAQAGGRREAAVAVLARALTLAADDETLRPRLLAIPPPAPAEVSAEAAEAAVTVQWSASATRVGPVRYRVERVTGRVPIAAGQAVLVGETDQQGITDTSPPVAEWLRYAVFAAREDGAWSEPAVTGRVAVTPEVSQLTVSADEREISGSWRAHPRTSEVLVTRAAGEPPEPGAGTAVGSRLDGFVDPAVSARVTYYYRVSACYLLAGRRHACPGTVVPARLQIPPEPVTALEAQVDYGGTAPEVRFGWRMPVEGSVVLVRSPDPPRLPVGTVIPAQRVRDLGTELVGQLERVPDRHARLSVRQSQGQRYAVTAVTVSGSQAVVGPTVEVALVPLVRELAGTRNGDTLRLAWAWPHGAMEARVTWRTDGADATGQQHCSLARYRQDNGIDITVGTGTVVVEVEAIVATADGPAYAPAATLRSPAPRPQVLYTINHQTSRRRMTVTVAFTADQPCELPPIDVVRSFASFLPARPDQGTVVHTIAGLGRLLPGTTVTTTFDIDARPSRPWWLVCFPVPGAGRSVSVEPKSRLGLRVT